MTVSKLQHESHTIMALRCSVLYCQADSRRLCFVVLSSFQRTDAPDRSHQPRRPPATNISVWGTL